MQDYIIQCFYNYFGNEIYDERTEKETQRILEKYGDRLSESEQEELLGMLMEFDRSSFVAGIKSVCAFFSGKNDFQE